MTATGGGDHRHHRADHEFGVVRHLELRVPRGQGMRQSTTLSGGAS
ncbi:MULTISPECIES: hypothetical protein [unclassified Streptomyces]|nr:MULTISPECIES: hypothetical protein [unclassified Streptomyces]